MRVPLIHSTKYPDYKAFSVIDTSNFHLSVVTYRELLSEFGWDIMLKHNKLRTEIYSYLNKEYSNTIKRVNGNIQFGIYTEPSKNIQFYSRGKRCYVVGTDTNTYLFYGTLDTQMVIPVVCEDNEMYILSLPLGYFHTRCNRYLENTPVSLVKRKVLLNSSFLFELERNEDISLSVPHVGLYCGDNVYMEEMIESITKHTYHIKDGMYFISNKHGYSDYCYICIEDACYRLQNWIGNAVDITSIETDSKGYIINKNNMQFIKIQTKGVRTLIRRIAYEYETPHTEKEVLHGRLYLGIENYKLDLNQGGTKNENTNTV